MAKQCPAKSQGRKQSSVFNFVNDDQVLKSYLERYFFFLIIDFHFETVTFPKARNLIFRNVFLTPQEMPF